MQIQRKANLIGFTSSADFQCLLPARLGFACATMAGRTGLSVKTCRRKESIPAQRLIEAASHEPEKYVEDFKQQIKLLTQCQRLI